MCTSKTVTVLITVTIYQSPTFGQLKSGMGVDSVGSGNGVRLGCACLIPVEMREISPHLGALHTVPVKSRGHCPNSSREVKEKSI